jgi:hypothetical protein
MGFEPQFSMNQKGSIYGIKTFKVPSAPGTYNVDLWGAHEKYYGVVPASLTFTVGPAAPTININFSYHEVLRKVKGWFQ